MLKKFYFLTIISILITNLGYAENTDRTKMFEPNTANNNASFLEKGVLANTNYDQLCLKLRAVYRENPGKKSFFENQQKFPVYYTQLWRSGI